MSENVTRGKGLLEGFLAKQRSKMANALIPQEARSGSILDIGCGSYPYFLSNTNFHEKHGLDKISNCAALATGNSGITLKNFDLESELRLPYENDTFEVVTMLAVLEHLDYDKIISIIMEVHRVIKKGGIFVVTTPSWWTDTLLKLLARLKLVSREELDEHKTLFSQQKISYVMSKAGFNGDLVQTGCFEFGMNLWAVARKH